MSRKLKQQHKAISGGTKVQAGTLLRSAETLGNQRRKLHQQLSELFKAKEQVHRTRPPCVGHFDEETNQVFVFEGAAGKLMRTAGQQVGECNAIVLDPEEALYLVERGNLGVCLEGVALSLRDCFHLLLGMPLTGVLTCAGEEGEGEGERERKEWKVASGNGGKGGNGKCAETQMDLKQSHDKHSQTQNDNKEHNSVRQDVLSFLAYTVYAHLRRSGFVVKRASRKSPALQQQTAARISSLAPMLKTLEPCLKDSKRGAIGGESETRVAGSDWAGIFGMEEEEEEEDEQRTGGGENREITEDKGKRVGEGKESVTHVPYRPDDLVERLLLYKAASGRVGSKTPLFAEVVVLSADAPLCRLFEEGNLSPTHKTVSITETQGSSSSSSSAKVTAPAKSPPKPVHQEGEVTEGQQAHQSLSERSGTHNAVGGEGGGHGQTSSKKARVELSEAPPPTPPEINRPEEGSLHPTFSSLTQDFQKQTVEKGGRGGRAMKGERPSGVQIEEEEEEEGTAESRDDGGVRHHDTHEQINTGGQAGNTKKKKKGTPTEAMPPPSPLFLFAIADSAGNVSFVEVGTLQEPSVAEIRDTKKT
uniref:tRNA-splicing endonuclease subunit Sen54 N-terminal domain-containing protein n=1 Tax=Chromera velia CCMP2878 TaxID=1169474 RepID=A0A0G4IG26_9ALVE|eukprot:Cvel_2508.t1-p1 / transcript=Cvel_2508.t1 / gene=Cvel_2508 / organism=Chromera_velia_CCMP2878 / gene_product=hypothetical protein / transcript_product=hypothetical protein / location=Cvel_scaffold98:124632-129683(-) / protein_length=588 / sequence_SO=supercontig / SO=protein_coding / is_pseudo=false